MLLDSFAASFKSLAWVAPLLGLFVYAAAIFCVVYFQDVEINGTRMFDTLPQAMLTMFNLSLTIDMATQRMGVERRDSHVDGEWESTCMRIVDEVAGIIYAGQGDDGITRVE